VGGGDAAGDGAAVASTVEPSVTDTGESPSATTRTRAIELA